jgi:hypothetical protein
MFDNRSKIERELYERNLLNKQNDEFEQANQEEVTIPFAPVNPEEKMMNVLQNSMSPSQAQTPFTIEQEPERDIASVQDEVSQLQSSAELPIIPSIAPSSSPKGTSNYDRILQELRAIRSGADSDIQTARKADSQNELMDSLSKSANTIGDAFANKAGFTKIKSDPISLKSNLSERAETDRKRKLEDLMSEYKMINDKDTKDEDRKYKNDMLAVARAKINNKAPSLTKGQESLDREFAKEADKYTSSGRVNALSSIKKLEEVVADLEKEGDGVFASGAGRTSVLHDSLRSKDSVKWRDNTITSANATLKELFGSQLSDAERESAANDFYNDNLSNAENAKIIKRKLSDLRAGMQNKDAKVAEFFKQGTLSNFNPSLTNKPSDKTITKKQHNKKAGKTKFIYSDGSEEIVDGIQ